MSIFNRVPLVLLLVAASFCCDAEESLECFAIEVEAHVLEQFRRYGPLSTNREYFGFIYLADGVIASAITRGTVCRWTESCEVQSSAAAAKTPKGAKILGEWHTHPHSTGSQILSPADVRGANANRHIRCYRAFFSTSNGEIFSWDPNATGVLMAMRSSVRLGNYREASGGQG